MLCTRKFASNFRQHCVKLVTHGRPRTTYHAYIAHMGGLHVTPLVTHKGGPQVPQKKCSVCIARVKPACVKLASSQLASSSRQACVKPARVKPARVKVASSLRQASLRRASSLQASLLQASLLQASLRQASSRRARVHALARILVHPRVRMACLVPQKCKGLRMQFGGGPSSVSARLLAQLDRAFAF